MNSIRSMFPLSILDRYDNIFTDKSLNNSWIEVFFVRSGKLIGKDNFIMSDIKHEIDKDILNAFIKQFYNKNPYIPPEVIIQYPIKEISLLEIWLSNKRNAKVKIIVPKRGVKRKLLNMVSLLIILVEKKKK